MKLNYGTTRNLTLYARWTVLSYDITYDLYMNLGKAAEAGYDTAEYCYCSASEQIVSRTDDCPDFYPHGCANGMCSYAKHKGNRCYCELYEQNVDLKQSCSDYLDVFDTELGDSVFDALR